LPSTPSGANSSAAAAAAAAAASSSAAAAAAAAACASSSASAYDSCLASAFAVVMCGGCMEPGDECTVPKLSQSLYVTRQKFVHHAMRMLFG